MEVISTQTLWRDYDRKALPLDESVLSTKTENGVTETRLYFSGMRVTDGVARIYARLLEPETANGKLPVVVVLGNVGDPIDDMRIQSAQYAILCIDYSGKKKAERFTVYPESLRFAEPSVNPDATFDLPASPQKTCWYVWATVLLRAITYIESRSELDASAIAAVGLGMGGASVWKAAALGCLKCGVVVNEAGGKIADTGFKASLDSSAYAAQVTVPVLSLCCSNALGQSLDEVCETVEKGDTCYLNVRSRAFRGIDGRQIDTVRTFLQSILDGIALPKPPTLRLSGSDGALYCEVQLDSEPVEVRLNVANSRIAPELRNWQKADMESTGEFRYIARVPVSDGSSPIFAFVRISYLNGLTLCTDLVEASPSELKIKCDERKKNRLIYDGDMGVDDWIAGDGGEAETALGPYEIAGVSGEEGLSTFKLSDRAYVGEEGYVLQMLLYSDRDQTIAVKVMTKTGEVHYTMRDVKRNDGWVKLSFEVTDFKSGDGTLDSWDDVAALRLTYEGKIIISNVLWV